jgi:16S rRNA processing protein RimM
MNKDDFYYLGKILKTSGSKGHLLAFLDVDHPERYKKLESVYVAVDHERIPFFIRSVELKPKKQAILLLEDFLTADDAEVFIGRELYLPLSHLPALKGKQFYYHEVEGFAVIDEERGNIGILTSIMDLPQQSLLQIMNDKKEILIPMNDEVLQKVDRKKKEMHIRAPEGLIDIYL